ncbi:hypothetical protein CBM2637_B120044 [Cupriavidus taiwanensis]|nr:hypothetical protein CBM2637_B120044 [Cupriavidus taiwanensis]
MLLGLRKRIRPQERMAIEMVSARQQSAAKFTIPNPGATAAKMTFSVRIVPNAIDRNRCTVWLLCLER